MVYGDEKIVVDVKDIDHGELLYKDENGQEHTYYPHDFMWVNVQTLGVVTSLREAHEEGAAPKVVTQVRGTAVLEDCSISVLGDPRSKVHVIEVNFEEGDWRPRQAKTDKGKDDLNLSGALGGAMLGFNRSDWELGSSDQWWSACYLPKDFIDRLIAELRGNRLRNMKLGLRLRGVYTTEHTYAPASSRGDLFLRPDKKDNTINMPELASGYVWSINFSTAGQDFRESELIGPIDQEEENSESSESEQVAVALASLSARLNQLRSTFKWIGGFIVVAILFLACRL